jgi:hypothetical protein
MSLLIITAAALLLLTCVFVFYPRKVETKLQEQDGTVFCKKCGARIAISNPSKIRQDFSAKCTACETRKFYTPVDLTR